MLRMVRVSEIRHELDELSVDYSDCFDKESLEERLKDAKEGRIHTREEVVDNSEGVVQSQTQHEDDTSDPTIKDNGQENFRTSDDANLGNPSSNRSAFDEGKAYEEVRVMKVKELREELAKKRIRWADLFEKEDLVRAVVNARKAAHNFSSWITPGIVADLTEQQVAEEMQSTTTPFLLDVYATWCGPCKMMASEISQAAEQWNDRVRLAKMDSDKYPNLSSKLKVHGLPTIVLFVNGQEIDRLEGALPKDQLMDWVESRI